MYNLFKSDFIKRWLLVLSIIFSAEFSVTAGLTAACLYASIVYKENVPFSNIMAISGSIFGGIAGAFLKDKYDKITGKNILEKKGRSAYRNLQGISQQLCNIKSWILEFSKKSKKTTDKRNLEELWRHILTVESNITSGLEDWRDIIPELKQIFEQNAEINKKYKDIVQTYTAEILDKRKELIVSKDAKRVEELKKKITELEKQVKDIKKERQEISSVSMSPSAIGMNASLNHPTINVSDIPNLATPYRKICMRCGKPFMHSMLSVNSGIYCPECDNPISDK